MSDDVFFDKLNKFRETRIRLLIPDRKIMIKELYKSFKRENTEIEICSLEDDSDSINIILSADCFFSGDAVGKTLNQLIGIANSTNIDIVDGKVIIDLWFRCWEFVIK